MVDTRRDVSVQITIEYFRKQHLLYRQSISQGVSGTTRHTDIDILIDTVGWLGGWLDGWRGGWADGQTDGRADTDGLRDGQTDRRTDTKTDRQTDR